jgi:hypothetical protein
MGSGVSERYYPEVALAVAVVQRVVNDMKEGSRLNKIKARRDIKRGYLDYWISAACEDEETVDVIKAGLRELAEL